MSDVYAEMGFGSTPVGFGEKPAIVVVDFQAAEIDPEFPFGGRPLIERGVQNTARLLAVARRCGIPVANAYTAYTSERQMPYWQVPAIRQHYIHGRPGTKLDARIYDPEYDILICKTGASIFFQTPVVSFLTKERVDTVVVTGCVTSGCIRASIIDCFQYGFRTIVPEDCVGDYDEREHQDNLRDTQRRYCDISSADEVISYFEQ